jgi:hypothetical protein
MEVVTELWKQPAPVLEETVSTALTKPVHSDIEISEDQAREVVERSVLLIGKQGYCLWTCRNLSGAVICIVDDSTSPAARLFDDWGMEKRVAMALHPVYTLDELSMLAHVDDWTQRMVLEAKRCTGTVVTEVHSD